MQTSSLRENDMLLSSLAAYSSWVTQLAEEMFHLQIGKDDFHIKLLPPRQ